VSTLTLNVQAIFDYLFAKGPARHSRSSDMTLVLHGMIDKLKDDLVFAHVEINQLKFLLASAPMTDAPTDRERLTATRSSFAYINPKTMADLLTKLFLRREPREFMVFPGSPTKWVLLSTMPEGRVIYSPLPIPGIEKILAKDL